MGARPLANIRAPSPFCTPESIGDMDFIEITVLNWEKYNPRKDVQHSSWLRFQHDLFDNHEFYDFSHAELCFWIYVLCLSSKKNSCVVALNLNHAKTIGRFTKSVIESAIQKLEVISAISRTRDVHGTCAVRPRALRDETNETNDHAQSADCAIDLNFETVYEKYPRKVGKKRGMTILKSTIKTPERLLAACQAVENYRRYLSASKTEPRFIKYFSTFANEWTDWLNASNGSSENFSKMTASEDRIDRSW